MSDDKEKASNVVTLQPKTTLKASEKLWGKPVMAHGFTITPNLLLQAQKRLDLQPRHVGVLLQLMSFYWDKSRPPFPTKGKLADLCNVSPKTIQRTLRELEEKGYIKRQERHHGGHNGIISNRYHFDGLEKKLKELEPEFTEVKKQKMKADKDVRTKGHSLRRKLAKKP